MLLERPKPAEARPLRAVEIKTPTPGAGEIRVRVSACGICHTDLHTVEGDLPLPRLPLVPGHEIVGVVDAAGAGVRNFQEGERVGIPWLYSTCGACTYCRKNMENLCERGRFTGFHVDGGYAEAVVVSESFAYALPRNFADFQAAPLLCAGIVGNRALKLSGAQSGDCLGLYGFGASAHIVLQLARHLGCEVFVFSRNPANRQLALRLGATWAGTAQDQPPKLLDAAILFAPAGPLALEALRATRKGGTVALAGITMSKIPPIDYDSLLYHERVLRSVANSTRQDARDLLQLAAEIPLRTEVRTFPLEEANQALQALKQGKIQGAGVLKV